MQPDNADFSQNARLRMTKEELLRTWKIKNNSPHFDDAGARDYAAKTNDSFKKTVMPIIAGIIKGNQ